MIPAIQPAASSGRIRIGPIGEYLNQKTCRCDTCPPIRSKSFCATSSVMPERESAIENAPNIASFIAMPAPPAAEAAAERLNRLRRPHIRQQSARDGGENQ